MITKTNYKIFAALVLTVLFFSCHKWDDYKKYQVAGEDIYPGKGDTVTVRSGKSRLMIDWVLSGDPSVTKYKLFLNNGSDSMEGEIPTAAIGKTFNILVNGLTEGTYSFNLYSLDKEGHSSVANIFNGKVYGPEYEKALLNRTPGSNSFVDNVLTINWGTPDTVNVTTAIKYDAKSGVSKTVLLSADSSAVTINDWKVGTKLLYKSSYKPNSSAIDTFNVLNYDTISIPLMIDKSTWKKVTLPNDVVTDAYGTSLDYLWDGQPGGYPNIYHSTGSILPHHFTFDMGKVYNKLSFVEETGRQDCSCHNVVDFEVWGIADTTGAATTLISNDAGWKDESIAKGWTLLKEVIRPDDGTAPFKIAIPENNVPVRFIRIRVIKTNDNNTESHMSEMSLWYNP